MGVESVRGVYDQSSLIATQAQGFVDPLLLLLFQARQTGGRARNALACLAKEFGLGNLPTGPYLR